MPWKRLEFEEISRKKKKQILRKARFYIDHNVDSSFVHILEHLKYDMQTATDISSQNQSDDFHFKYASDTNRILLTQDKDFLNEKLFPSCKTKGIIVLNIDTSDTSQIARALEVITLVLGQISPVLEKRKVTLNSDYTFSIIRSVRTAGSRKIQRNRYHLDANYAYIWDNG